MASTDVMCSNQPKGFPNESVYLSCLCVERLSPCANGYLSILPPRNIHDYAGPLRPVLHHCCLLRGSVRGEVTMWRIVYLDDFYWIMNLLGEERFGPYETRVEARLDFDQGVHL